MAAVVVIRIQPDLAILSSLLLFLLPCFLLTPADAIDCFKCVSMNGDNPACEDPFHNNFTSDLLESPCMGGRKGRNGLFPATACLKLAGRYGTKQFIINNSLSFIIFLSLSIVNLSYPAG